MLHKLPALIIRAPYALAAVSGVPIGKERVFKLIECRGVRLRTTYRGAVAIFASRNYQATDEDVLADVSECYRGKRKDARRWCREVFERWRYKLVGFVRLTDCVTSEQIAEGTEADRLAIHAAAFDLAGTWQVETYLGIEPLHALAQPGPEFTAACAGCLAQPPHNATACHVGWQTTLIDARLAPGHVVKAIGEWR